MANFMQSVDERTRLAGANRLEILLFSLGRDSGSGREETFGINVFKVREVMRIPEITQAPEMPPSVQGMVSLRGQLVPVVDLAQFCGIRPEGEARIMIVTEYNKHTQGFLVYNVENILRLEWSQIRVPPPMITARMGGLVTAVTELKDGRIVMVMDVEKVLAETIHADADSRVFEDLKPIERSATVLFADDSSVARKQIETTLQYLGINYISASNGREAWEKLQELAKRAENSRTPLYEMLQLILTDVEMPEMDGYVLTKTIKSDPRFKGIPVAMHSSLSSNANLKIGRAVGADAYVPKFDPKELAETIRPFLNLKSQAANA